MRISRPLIALSVTVLSLCSSDLVRRGPRAGWPAAGSAGAPGFRVALLDVNYIFKNHARFKQMMEEMKGDVQRAEEQVKSESRDYQKACRAAERVQAGYARL